MAGISRPTGWASRCARGSRLLVFAKYSAASHASALGIGELPRSDAVAVGVEEHAGGLPALDALRRLAQQPGALALPAASLPEGVVVGHHFELQHPRLPYFAAVTRFGLSQRRLLQCGHNAGRSGERGTHCQSHCWHA